MLRGNIIVKKDSLFQRDRTFEAVLKWKADIDSKVTLPSGEVIPVILLANKVFYISKKLTISGRFSG
jgi:hypothetical protein